MFRELQPQNYNRATSSTPNFYVYDASDSASNHKIGVTWGLFNDMQPNNMIFGNRTPFTLNINDNQGYIYLSCTANIVSRKWGVPQISISTSSKTSTSSIYYKLLGTFSIIDNRLYVISWEGGDIDVDFCNL